MKFTTTATVLPSEYGSLTDRAESVLFGEYSFPIGNDDSRETGPPSLRRGPITQMEDIPSMAGTDPHAREEIGAHTEYLSQIILERRIAITDQR